MVAMNRRSTSASVRFPDASVVLIAGLLRAMTTGPWRASHRFESASTSLLRWDEEGDLIEEDDDW
jgi:hypothetical protein